MNTEATSNPKGHLVEENVNKVLNFEFNPKLPAVFTMQGAKGKSTFILGERLVVDRISWLLPRKSIHYRICTDIRPVFQGVLI